MESFDGLCCTSRSLIYASTSRATQDEQPPQAQQAEMPIEIIPLALAAPSIVPMPEATSSAPPTTSEAPPVVPATSAPPPSESSITISSLEFRGPCHTLQTLSHHSRYNIIWLFCPLEHDMPCPSKLIAPSEEATPAEQAIPSEEATLAE
ncbi:hypothetical protein CK203_065700 [Vitis vinifera]|uniref:Uncharacterized protein n=1 Tax=Vitis vinifera TaxID=29760 RepID=A0A438G2F6_VITVI|nr:hypothetical protein CK203_065700 [Vitis vinifera]